MEDKIKIIEQTNSIIVCNNIEYHEYLEDIITECKEEKK